MPKVHRPMTFLGAAQEVLTRSEGPLTAREILDRAVRLRLLGHFGKTPLRTLCARLYVDVARNPDTPFRRLARAGRTRAERNSVRWALR